MSQRRRHRHRHLLPLAALLLAIGVPLTVWALNELPNWGFENAAAPGGPWTGGGSNTATETAFARVSTLPQEGANCFDGYWTGTANNNTFARTLTASYTPTATVRAKLRTFYKRRGNAGVDNFTFAVTLKQSTTVIATAVNSNLVTTDGAWVDSGWSPVVTLTGGTAYTVEVSWAGQVDNGEAQGAYVDNIQLSVSPEGLSATSVAGTKNASLSWAVSAPGANGPALRATNSYQIHRSTTSGGEVALGVYSATTSYTDTSTTGNTTYYYTITDFDQSATAIESPQSTEVSVLTRPGAPGTPTFSGVTATNITLTWTAPTGGTTTYKVERAPDNAGSPGTWADVTTGVAGLTWSDTTVTCGNTYWYRVTGTNASGYGAPSAQASRASTACPSGTLTLGNFLTADVPSSTICYNAGATNLDYFTLLSTAPDTVNGVTVGLTGDTSVLSSVSVTTDADGPLGTDATPTASNPITTSFAAPTGSALQYRVKITPNPAMPVLGTYTFTGNVSGVSDSNNFTKAGTDSVAGTITIDNAAPLNASGLAASNVTSTSMQVSWTNPGADFQSAMVVRGTASVTGVPAKGTTYSLTNQLPLASVNETVVAVGEMDGIFDDSGLTAGTTYYYRVFVRDACGIWSAPGVQLSQPTNAATSLALGNALTTDVPSSTICYNAPATDLDYFTLLATTADTVTGVTVALTGTVSVLSTLTVTDDVSAVILPTVANPAPSNVINFTTPFAAPTGSAAQYRVKVTPNPAMPGDGTHTFTGNVTEVRDSAALPKTGSDAVAGTLTIDNAAPGNVPVLAASAVTSVSMTVGWTNPGTDFHSAMVVRGTASVTGVPAKGTTYSLTNQLPLASVNETVVAVGETDGLFNDSGLSAGTTYYYRVFVRDACGIWSATGAQISQATSPTLNVANGTPTPTSLVVCPGDATTRDVNAFTVATSPAGTDTVNSLTVDFTNGGANAGAASGVGTATVTNDAASTTYATQALPSGSQAFTLSPTLSATTTPSQYHVRALAKSHAAMAAPPGANYPVTALLTAVGHTGAGSVINTTSLAGSGTLTIDNSSSSDVTGLSASAPASGQTSVVWTNPAVGSAPTDFGSYVVVLRNTVSITDRPVEGTASYTAGGTLGTSSIACVGSIATCAQSGLPDGALYYYKVFTRDGCSNWSVGAQTSVTTQTALIVANGTPVPTSVVVCPGDATTRDVNAFTLATSPSGTDTVNAFTVDFTNGGANAGAAAAVATATVTNDGATTTYATQASPSDSQAFSLSPTTIAVTTTAAQYHVRALPKGHAAMPAAPGANYPVTARIVAVGHTGSGAVTNNGTIAGSGTLTIDNSASSQVSGLSASAPGAGQASLVWTNPAAGTAPNDFGSYVVVLRNTAPITDQPTEGTASYTAGGTIGTSSIACVGSIATCAQSGLPSSTLYYYKVFTRDSCANWSLGAQTSVTTQDNRVTPGTPTVSSTVCTQATVSSPYTGDANGNSTTTVARGLNGTTFGTTICSTISGASPRSCVDNTTAENTLYYYQVTYADGEPVLGTNPRVVNITTPACPPVLTLWNPGGQPPAANVMAGSSTDVGKFTLTANKGSVFVDSVGIGNLGSTLPAVDVLRLQLFDDGTGALLGATNWDASTSTFRASTNFSVVLGVPVTVRVVLVVATGATVDRTFRMNVAASAIVVTNSATTTGTSVATNIFTVTAGPTQGNVDANAPTVLIVNPMDGAAVTGPNFRVQVQVYNPGGLGALTGVTLSSNGGGDGFPTTLTKVASYNVGANAAIYGATLTLVPGAYTLIARAANTVPVIGPLTTNSAMAAISVAPAGMGDGLLLVRDNSSQLCSDCHAIQTHSAQAMGGTYGAWGVNCRDCHTTHNTTNIYLVKKSITPPARGAHQPARAVKFSTKSGYDPTNGATTASFANADNTGPCQVCHQQTVSMTGATRYQRSGNADTHYSINGTENCTNCHTHATGFKGKTCVQCHTDAVADTDNWASDAGPAKVGLPEWTTVGHGLTADSGYASGNLGAGMDTQGTTRGDRGCLYCHDDGVGHGQTANPFRLANTTLPEGPNGACLVCHSGAYTGFDPDGASYTAYAAMDGAKNVNKAHYNALHTATNNGGKYCWDCHDPHGDKSAAGNTLWYMLHRQPFEKTVNQLPTVLASPIEFRKETGGDDAGTSSTKLDYQDYVAGGLCKNCHAADGGVAHFTKTLSTPTHFTANGSNLVDAPNDRCTDCHKHAAGFKQLECNGCHDSPTNVGKHRAHNDVGWQLGTVPTSFAALTPSTTALKYGYACAKCHAGTHQNALSGHTGGSADPYPVEVIFDTTTPPANPGATYVAVYKDTVVQGTELLNPKFFSATTTTTGTNGRCSNAYCHSNAAPLDGGTVYQPVQWGAAAVGCNGCHTVPGATASAAHTKHVTTFGIACQRCHFSASADSLTVTDKRVHADGVKTVAFDSLWSNDGGTYNSGTYTCSNTYCHSSGVTSTGPYVSGPSAAWNAPAGCASCHGGTMANTPIATGKHTQHIANAGVLGTNFGCVRCHNTTVNASDVIISTANHVNGAKNVGFTEAGTYLSPPTCANSYCHSTGQATPAFRSVRWDEALWVPAELCSKCHGTTGTFGAPDYVTGNSHANTKHVAAATDCVKCHATSVTAAGTAIAPASTVHLDSTRTVAIIAALDTNLTLSNYNNGTKTCSGVSCHGNNDVVWGSTVMNCGSCHWANNALMGVHAKHWAPATLATATTAANGTTTTTYQYGCGYCHPTGAANHAAGDVSANQAAQVAFSGALGLETLSGTYDAGGTVAGTDRGFDYTNGTCAVYCHSNATPVGGVLSTKAPTWTGAALTCAGCHNTAARTDTAVTTDLSAAHGKHIQSTILETGSYAYTCDACHAGVIRATPNNPWALEPLDLSNKTLHVQGQHSVTFSSTLLGKNQSAATYNQAPAYTCANSYCHSAGTSFTLPFGSVTSTAWTGTTTCSTCHGSPPAYANNSPKANSHAKHASYTCQSCHSGVVTGSTTIASPALHVNGAYTVAAPAGQFTVTDAGTATNPTTCASISCHGGNPAVWGATITCRGCHDQATGETDDLGASFWNNGRTATINVAEWTWSGHGKTGSTFYDVSGWPAAAFPTTPTPGTSECLYCHDDTIPHQTTPTSTNPFRLRNTGTADGQNGNCLVCHKTLSAGVTPAGQTLKNGTKKGDTAHDGAKHTGLPTLGGKFCWDCHDPHGDRPSNTNSAGNNIFMIQRAVFATQDGTYGYLGGAGIARDVQYYYKAAHTASDTGDTGSVGKMVETNTALGTAHVGLCQACHETSVAAPFSKYWGYTGYDDTDGNVATVVPYRSGRVATPNHNSGSYCISCHSHGAKFVGAGGGPNCLSSQCHGVSQGARRAVPADFADGTTPGFRSHHVGNSTTNTLRGTLDNYDCGVCHAEAIFSGGVLTDTGPLHMNSKIDLRDVDSATNASFAYDKDAVALSAGAVANWGSGNAVWATQTSTMLDPFCLSCHDVDGASQIANFRLTSPLTQTAHNPFADSAGTLAAGSGHITNNYDQVGRGTSIVNVRNMVDSSVNDLNAAITPVDRDEAFGGQFFRGPDTRADPTQGIYARHAIRGKSVSVYGGTNAIWDTATYWANPTVWKSNSVMGCADCHTSDGANGAAGNAHGANSEYMLKNNLGGVVAAGGETMTTSPCFRCHLGTWYNNSSNHAQNGGDYFDSTSLVGAPRRQGGTDGNMYGIACMNCHGGVPDKAGALRYGTIHGTSQTMAIGATSGTPATWVARPAYRFMNGNSMRWYDPNGWTNVGATCYTIGAVDNFGGCAKHGGGGGYTRDLPARPIKY